MAAEAPKIKLPKVRNLYPNLMSIPESCVTTQKKLSLACTTTAEPAPIAITTIAFCSSVSNPKVDIIGAKIEAAVINATVDEP